jgi:hypothetical protein
MEGCGAKCEVKFETQGTATLFMYIPSSVVKSVSKKLLLHKYY